MTKWNCILLFTLLCAELSAFKFARPADYAFPEVIVKVTANTTLLIRNSKMRDIIYFKGPLEGGSLIKFRMTGSLEVVATEIQYVHVRKPDGSWFKASYEGMGKCVVEIL